MIRTGARRRNLRGRLRAALLLTVVGCGGQGTDLGQLVDTNVSTDSAAPLAADGAAETTPDPFTGAAPYAATTGPSSHNAGKACVQSGCHATSGGGAAPAFFFGGTVYTDYLGQTPAVGAEVRVADTQGHTASVYSGPEGNFYLSAASASNIAFPAYVAARDATTTRAMVTALPSSAFAACGQASCHVPGGGPLTATGNYYPIHVP